MQAVADSIANFSQAVEYWDLRLPHSRSDRSQPPSWHLHPDVRQRESEQGTEFHGRVCKTTASEFGIQSAPVAHARAETASR